jgi:hypothetical protein
MSIAPSVSPSPDVTRQFLRHTLAVVAYRGGKAVRGAPESFAAFRSGDSSRTPAKILAHLGDLFDWALAMSQGRKDWHDSTPLPWNAEVERFFAALRKFDDHLASSEPLQAPAEKLFQGPIADALTHIGQIAMLRRLANAPIRGENYFVADIATGRCGSEQSAPHFEFD